MHIALVANSRSGSALGPGELERRLAAGGATVHATAIGDLPGSPEGFDRASLEGSIAMLTAEGPPDRLVVAGGDGSIGVLARLAAELDRPLAVIPAGTANDFARATRIPLDLHAAAELAADPGAAARPAELALVGERPFVNAASAGLSVIAAHEATRHKQRLGALAYGVGALKAGATASTVRCRVLCDGSECFAGDVWQVVVGVTGAFGGGSSIGGTEPDDERIDAAIVPAGSRTGLARRAFGMRTGRLTAQDDVPHLQAATIEVELDDPQFNVDGELSTCDPARFCLHPGGFRVVAPAQG